MARKKVTKVLWNLIFTIILIHSSIELSAEEDLELVVQLGHSATTNSVCFSPDNKYAVSGGKDSILVLWDVLTAKKIRSFSGHAGDINSVSFSPGMKKVLSGSEDGTVKLWDIDTGSELLTFEGHSGFVKSVCFSSDGRFVLSGGGDTQLEGELKLWDASSGKEILTFKGNSKEIYLSSITNDSKYALAACYSGDTGLIFRKWDVITGEELKSIPYKYGTIGDFSSDGKYALWVRSVKRKDRFLDHTVIKLLNITTGDEMRTFDGYYRFVSAVRFSPDGKYVIAAVHESLDKIGLEVKKSLIQFEVATGKVVRSLICDHGWISSIGLSSDGKRALTTSWDKNTLKLWDITSGQEIRTFRGYSKGVNTVSFSPDWRHVLIGSEDPVLRLWDITDGREVKRLTGHSGTIRLVSFSPNGAFAVSVGGEIGEKTELKYWDMLKGKELRSFEDSKYIGSLCFAPDSESFLTGSENEIRHWDIATGRLKRSFKNFSSLEREDVSSICFSPDERCFLSGGEYVSIKLWDFIAGEEVRSFDTIDPKHSRFYRLSVSPDGKYVLSGSFDLELWDLSSGKNIKTLERGSYAVASVSFSPNGKLAISGRRDALTLWDIETGQPKRTFTGHTDWVKSVGFSPDGKYIMSSSWDSTTRVWDIETGNYVAFISASDSNDWLAYTHDGYWDASRNGSELIAMVRATQVWNIDQFAVRNNRPDIVLERLGSKNKSLIRHYYNLYKSRLKKLGLSEKDITQELHVPEATIVLTDVKDKFAEIKCHLSDSRYDLKKYNIYVNDVPIFGAYGKPISGRSTFKTELIELTAGKNKIEVSCLNDKGAESYRALTYVSYDKKVVGDLYFIGFGVSEYEDQSLNLKYAHQDVSDLAMVFQSMIGSFKKIHIKTYINKDVTQENIIKAKQFLSSAKVDDIFVLFISGHGVHDMDALSTYYYLTHNTDLKNLKSTAADFELIENLMQGIAPRRKLFLMDTCESGEVEEETQNQYVALANNKGIRPRTTRKLRGMRVREKVRRTYLFQKDRYIYNDLIRRSGAIVFSSSKGGEFSYEMDELKNGLFTEELINALTSSKADKNGDSFVTVDELRNYVPQAVARLSGDLQHPTVDRDNIYLNFAFPLVE